MIATSRSDPWFCAAMLCLIIALGCDNQVVGPNADRAPVVPALPKISSELRRVKGLCEAHASAEKGSAARIRLARRRDAAIHEGAELYGAAKADVDAVVSYLRSGLSRRFKSSDSSEIQKRLDAAHSSANDFLAWQVGAGRRASGSGTANPASPLADVLSVIPQLVSDWIQEVNKANQQAIKELRADLEACRMRDWVAL